MTRLEILILGPEMSYLRNIGHNKNFSKKELRHLYLFTEP